MKKLFKLSLLSSLLLPLLLVIICAAAITGDSSNTSSNGSSTGKRTTLTAKEVAQKASITEERAEDVIKILNYQLSKEGFTLAGSSGNLAVAERESGFDPKAINTGGGVAGYFQWSAGLTLSTVTAGHRLLVERWMLMLNSNSCQPS